MKGIEFKKVVVIVKSKETSSQLNIGIMNLPALATVSSNTYSQMHVQIKHSLAHLHIGFNPCTCWCENT